jgi:hypothetical protein
MSTTAPAALSIPAFNHFTTIGSLEIGIINALFLSGILTVQVFLYFRRHELYARIVNRRRRTPTDGSRRRLTPSVDIF